MRWLLRRRGWISILALMVLLGTGALALWPVPGKGPLAILAVALGAAGLSRWRLRQADDVGAWLVGFGAVIGLGTWTLASWASLDLPGALLLGAILAAAPFLLVVLAAVRAGSADDPDADDEG